MLGVPVSVASNSTVVGEFAGCWEIFSTSRTRTADVADQDEMTHISRCGSRNQKNPRRADSFLLTAQVEGDQLAEGLSRTRS
jgi:hypothetical protein